jgi:hypothetical protein
MHTIDPNLTATYDRYSVQSVGQPRTVDNETRNIVTILHIKLGTYSSGNNCDPGYGVVPLLHSGPPNECNRSREQNKKTFAYSTNHGGVKSEIVGALTDSGDLSAPGPSISFSIQ